MLTMKKAMDDQLQLNQMKTDNQKNGRQILAATNTDSVYKSLRPIVMISTSLGVMPLTRVMARHSEHLTFKWYSVQTVATMVLLACLTLSSAMAAYFYTAIPVASWNIKEMAIRPRESIFYASCAAFVVLSLRTCHRLPDLFRQWDGVADRLHKYLTVIQQANMSCRLHLSTMSVLLFSATFMMSAAIEHILHDLTIVHGRCDNATWTPADFDTFLECYYVRGNEYFAFHVQYNVPTAVGVFILNKFATIAWNFPDLLLVLLSLALRANFKVIALYLKVTSISKKSRQEWMELRNDHYCLVGVVQDLERILSPTVLLSYAVNIYFLCIQIFYAIRPCVRTPIEAAYFYSSFFHLLFRMCAVSFAAASFYDEAMEPLQYLHRCPSSSYCEEVHRFICQISLTPAAFTGCRFFTINRHLFLAIISVILTYELILLNVP